MDPEDAIWDALNDDQRRANRHAHDRHDRNTNNDAALPFAGPLIVPDAEEGEDPNELLAAVARMHLADIEALREAGAGEDALLALDLFGDELRQALEMVENREAAARAQQENATRGNNEGERDQNEAAGGPPARAEGAEPTLASLIRRIPGAWALPLPLGGAVHEQPPGEEPRHEQAAAPAEHERVQDHARAGDRQHAHDHDHDDQAWNPGWLLSAARQWMLGNGTPPDARDHDPDVPPECVVCQDVIAPGEVVRAPCGHTYDVHCMNTVFMNAARDEALFPPRCCKTTIPTELVRGRIPTTTLSTFSARAAEFATPKRLYCAAPTCSAFLGARYTGWFFAKAVLCPGCGAQTCSRCAQKVDPGVRHRCRPAEDENAIAAVAAQEEWARCPDCEAFVELVIGCNHMTCRCGAEFCYVCSRRWKTCGCPWWDEDRLLAVREERHERRRRRRRERREREAREQAAAEGGADDGSGEEADDVAPVRVDEPPVVAPPAPVGNADGADADALPRPAPHVEEAPAQAPAGPGPIMQALMEPPPGEAGAIFLRPSLRTRRTVDVAPPEQAADTGDEVVPPHDEAAPPHENTVPIGDVAPPQSEVNPATEEVISPPVERAALPATAPAEAVAPAAEAIPPLDRFHAEAEAPVTVTHDMEDEAKAPVEPPQAPTPAADTSSRRGSRASTVDQERGTASANMAEVSTPVDDDDNVTRVQAQLSEQLKVEEPLPVPAPQLDELRTSAPAGEAAPPSTVISERAPSQSRRHRSQSRSHRSTSRAGSRATRYQVWMPSEAQETVEPSVRAEHEKDIQDVDHDEAGPDIVPDGAEDAQDEVLNATHEAYIRQALKEMLPPLTSSRNRRPNQAPVPPAPSPAPPESARRRPPANAEIFYTPPAHTSDLRVPAAPPSTLKVYSAPPLERRTSSSRSTKSEASQSKRASSRRGEARTRRDSQGEQASGAAPPRSMAEIIASKPVKSHSQPLMSGGRPRSSSHRYVKPVAAPAPPLGRTLSSTAIPEPVVDTPKPIPPTTQPLAVNPPSVASESSSAKRPLRRAESLQRETRARRETREHWERMQAASGPSSTQQPVDVEVVEGKKIIEMTAPARHHHSEKVAEPTRRGRDDVASHRASRHGKGRTVTYMTFEAAQNASVPLEWMDDATSVSSHDIKGKRRASEPSAEGAAALSRTQSPGSAPQSAPQEQRRMRHQWDPPPKGVYKLHARLRPPVDPLAYASRLMRKTARARRTLQHVPLPDDRSLRTALKEYKPTGYQRPPPVVYAQSTIQRALLPLRGATPPEAAPVISGPEAYDVRPKVPATASAGPRTPSLDHKTRPHPASTHRPAARESAPRSASRLPSPSRSPRTAPAARAEQHSRPTPPQRPKPRPAATQVEDLPLHQIYSRFAPFSSLHPPSPPAPHRFAPVSTLHPPMPPPPPEAEPVYACPPSRQVMESAIPPEGPPIPARRHTRPSRRESDPADISAPVPRAPKSTELLSGTPSLASPYVHSTAFRRATKGWQGCPHDLWAYGFGPGQCVGCLAALGETVYRCESCGAVACADCLRDKY